MSVSSSIEIKISSNTWTKALKAFCDYGWRITRYLPKHAEVGDEEKKEIFNGNYLKLIDILQEKEKLKEVILLELAWQDSDIEVTLIIDHEYIVLNFSIFVFRQTVQEYPRYTDFSWYTPKLLSPLRDASIRVEYIRYEDLG